MYGESCGAHCTAQRRSMGLEYSHIRGHGKTLTEAFENLKNALVYNFGESALDNLKRVDGTSGKYVQFAFRDERNGSDVDVCWNRSENRYCCMIDKSGRVPIENRRFLIESVV